MAIDGIQGRQDRVQVEERYRQGGGNGNRSGRILQGDSVELSSQTQELLRVKNLVDAAPDVRLDRVEQLRREIAAGTYEVSSAEIADAIIDAWI